MSIVNIDVNKYTITPEIKNELMQVLEENGISQESYILEKRFVTDIEDDNMNFYIKDYQRGYRWTEDEIVDLLNDINEINGDDCYCVQPLVVKRIKSGNTADKYACSLTDRKESSFENESGSLESESFFELIDGQQRLTTIFLILNHINNTPQYKIFYEHRRSIDDYYIAKARNTIENWFKNLNPEHSEFVRKIKKQVFFIWYEVCDESESGNSNKIFQNINAGKVELTNAELFRAMLLNEDNIDGDPERLHKIIRFSFEWDTLEQKLRNDDFWFFIASKQFADMTRIDFLLELYALSLLKSERFNVVPENRRNIFDPEKERFSFNVVKTYVEYKSRSEPKFDILKEVFKEIAQIYDLLYTWYHDNELYHYIGYLIACEKSKGNALTSKTILNYYEAENRSRPMLKAKAQSEIANKFRNITIDDLCYRGSKTYDFLLFFNIWSTMKNRKLNGRFPFSLFKAGKWDQEHIRSRKPKEFNSSDSISVKEIQEMAQAITNDLYPAKDSKEDIFGFVKDEKDIKSLISTWNEKIKNLPQDNSLGNITLLNEEINRSYHNDFFKDKREQIIKRDSENAYIPLCTRNVFLKYYTNPNENTVFTAWSENDKKGYLEALEECLNEVKRMGGEI